MRCRLTRRVVEAAKPKAAPYEIRDTEVKGLLLRVQPSGAMSYVVEWARGKRVTLGAAGAWTVEKAKTEAQRYLLQAREDGAPTVVSDRLRKAARSTGDVIDTLGELLVHRYEPWVRQERKSGAATVARLRSCFAAFLAQPLANLTAWELERWRAQRLGAGIAVNTVNRDITALKAVLAKAVEWGVLSVHTLATVKPKKSAESGVVRWLSFTGEDHEEGRMRKALQARDMRLRADRKSANRWRKVRGYALLPAIPVKGYGDHLTPLTLLALNTGLRRGELTSLTWPDVDLERRMLTVRAGYAKSGKARHVPLNREAAAVLTCWKGQCTDAKVFSVLDVKKSWAALLKAAGISDFRFHDLRHHFASRLVMAGVDLNTVRELLGHADLKMTLRYAHLAPEFKAAAVELIAPAN